MSSELYLSRTLSFEERLREASRRAPAHCCLETVIGGKKRWKRE